MHKYKHVMYMWCICTVASGQLIRFFMPTPPPPPASFTKGLGVFLWASKLAEWNGFKGMKGSGGLDTLPTLTYTKARLLVEDWSDWYTQSANQSWQPIAPNKPYDCSALWCVQDRQWMVHTDVLLWYVTMVMDGVWLKKWLVWVLVADCGGGDHVSHMMSSLEIDS